MRHQFTVCVCVSVWYEHDFCNLRDYYCENIALSSPWFCGVERCSGSEKEWETRWQRWHRMGCLLIHFVCILRHTYYWIECLKTSRFHNTVIAYRMPVWLCIYIHFDSDGNWFWNWKLGLLWQCLWVRCVALHVDVPCVLDEVCQSNHNS